MIPLSTNYAANSEHMPTKKFDLLNILRSERRR